jgi:hypothetical protein
VASQGVCRLRVFADPHVLPALIRYEPRPSRSHSFGHEGRRRCVPLQSGLTLAEVHAWVGSRVPVCSPCFRIALLHAVFLARPFQLPVRIRGPPQWRPRHRLRLMVQSQFDDGTNRLQGPGGTEEGISLRLFPRYILS